MEFPLPAEKPVDSSATPPVDERGSSHQSSSMSCYTLLCKYELIVSSADSTETVVPPPQLSSLPEVSGQDALVAHLKDVEEQRAASENGPQPILLGERALSSEHTTIAEVLHSNPPSGPTSPNTGSSPQQLAQQDNA